MKKWMMVMGGVMIIGCAPARESILPEPGPVSGIDESGKVAGLEIQRKDFSAQNKSILKLRLTRKPKQGHEVFVCFRSYDEKKNPRVLTFNRNQLVFNSQNYDVFQNVEVRWPCNRNTVAYVVFDIASPDSAYKINRRSNYLQSPTVKIDLRGNAGK